MKPDLTIAEFIAALRAKAQDLNNRADTLEKDWREIVSGIAVDPPKSHAVGSPPREDHKPVSADELKAALSTMKGRIKTFAEHFGTSEAIIAALVGDPKNGLDNSDRGWIRLKPTTE